MSNGLDRVSAQKWRYTPVDTGSKLNVLKKYNLRPVSAGTFSKPLSFRKTM